MLPPGWDAEADASACYPLEVTKSPKKWRSKLDVAVGPDRSEASDLLSLMALDACAGDLMTVRIEGPDEVEASIAIAELLGVSI